MIKMIKSLLFVSLLSISSIQLHAGVEAQQLPATRADVLLSDFLEVLNDVALDFQRSAVQGAKKITAHLEPAEKQKLLEVINLLKQLFAKYEQATIAGGAEQLSAKDQQEINQLKQQLIISSLPLLMVLQNPDFFLANERIINDKTIEMMGTIKRTIEDIANEL